MLPTSTPILRNKDIHLAQGGRAVLQPCVSLPTSMLPLAFAEKFYAPPEQTMNHSEPQQQQAKNMKGSPPREGLKDFAAAV